MSEQTYKALADALAAHVADVQPEHPYVTAWALTAASVGADMDETAYTNASSNTAYHVLLGLREHGTAMLVAAYDDDE